MIYQVKFSKSAKKQFLKIDKPIQRQIQGYIDRCIDGSTNPRANGKALKGSYSGLWRYEVGDYRIICNITDGICEILVVKVKHRRDAYD